MTIEVPVLRLGLAGFTEAHQKLAAAATAAASSSRARWEISAFSEADAWWLDGSRTVLLPDQHLRVQPATPPERAVQLALADVDRPVGFSLPITAPGFKPAVTFKLGEHDATTRVLHQFVDWLQVMLSQFALDVHDDVIRVATSFVSELTRQTATRVTTAAVSMVSRRTGSAEPVMHRARVVGTPSPAMASEPRNSRIEERSTARPSPMREYGVSPAPLS